MKENTEEKGMESFDREGEYADVEPTPEELAAIMSTESALDDDIDFGVLHAREQNFQKALEAVRSDIDAAGIWDEEVVSVPEEDFEIDLENF